MTAQLPPRTYPQGVPCWVDIERNDPHAAADFYRGLFGWDITSAVPPDAPFTYLIAQLDGQDVAGIGSSGGLGGEWKTYVAVEDCDASTERVRAAGGRVTGEPVDAGPGGRWSEFVDPQGALLRLWQARRRIGAQAVNRPGGWCFSDLHTPDVAAAEEFYAGLFGWSYEDVGLEAIQVPGYGDHLAAGADPDIRERQKGAPAGFADAVGAIRRDDDPHWHVTFLVADRDSAAGRAQELGAEVLATYEEPWTRKVDLRDPDGAVFTASQFVPPDAS